MSALRAKSLPITAARSISPRSSGSRCPVDLRVGPRSRVARPRRARLDVFGHIGEQLLDEQGVSLGHGDDPGPASSGRSSSRARSPSSRRLVPPRAAPERSSPDDSSRGVRPAGSGAQGRARAAAPPRPSCSEVLDQIEQGWLRPVHVLEHDDERLLSARVSKKRRIAQKTSPVDAAALGVAGQLGYRARDEGRILVASEERPDRRLRPCRRQPGERSRPEAGRSPPLRTRRTARQRIFPGHRAAQTNSARQPSLADACVSEDRRLRGCGSSLEPDRTHSVAGPARPPDRRRSGTGGRTQPVLSPSARRRNAGPRPSEPPTSIGSTGSVRSLLAHELGVASPSSVSPGSAACCSRIATVIGDSGRKRLAGAASPASTSPVLIPVRT